MKWFGYPVETITAMINGKISEVAIVYQWAGGKRRTRWLVPKATLDQNTIKHKALA